MSQVDWGNLVVDLPDDPTLLDQFKVFLGIDPGDNAQDAELTAALGLAGDSIEVFLDRQIAKRPVDEYFVHHFGTVDLHHMPVDTDAPLNVFADGEQDDNYEVFLYMGKTAKLTRIGHDWDIPMDWRKFDLVTVTYTAGYDPLPSDLAQAILYTAGGVFSSQGTGSAPGGASGDVKSMTVFDVGTVAYDVGSSSGAGTGNDLGIIPATAGQMLSRYARLVA